MCIGLYRLKDSEPVFEKTTLYTQRSTATAAAAAAAPTSCACKATVRNHVAKTDKMNASSAIGISNMINISINTLFGTYPFQFHVCNTMHTSRVKINKTSKSRYACYAYSEVGLQFLHFISMHEVTVDI